MSDSTLRPLRAACGDPVAQQCLTSFVAVVTHPVLCLQATEQDLWSLFSPIGNILELYILRGPSGLSRGCGFVTYANRYLAQQAIMQLNGKQVPPGKVLVVKLADRSLPSKPAAALPGSY